MRSLITILLLSILPARLSAAIEVASDRLVGNQITTSGGPHLTVFDNKYATMATNVSWPSLFTNYRITNKIRLGINPEVLQTDNLSGGVTLSITYWKWDTGTAAFVTSTESKTLAVDYSTTPTNSINDLSTYVTDDALKIEITITAINGGSGFDVNDVFLEVEIETERYYPFAGTSPTGQTVSISGSNIEFDWIPVTGAEYYELEWVHINNYKADGTAFTTADLSVNFYRNSTRLILRTPFYELPNIFDKGYVVFRVRGIGLSGNTFTQRNEGTWSISESITVSSLTSGTHYLAISAEYDPDMNWGYQVAYAEDGKRFEGISYADGLGMVRQSIGYNPVTNQAVVSTIYYDGFGRPAVSALPTPDVNASPFVHRLNFNTASGETFYGPEHFDHEQLEEDANCTFATMPFSTTAGAGKYYSSSNPDKTEENKRIPDAGGYPFARVEYTDDHTGRIRRAGGVGPDFQIGSGRETAFLYGIPYQEELDRLFGTEVGYAPHYQRRITIDANNQAYVEYFDMAGRVVASGLIGETPDNLDELLTNETFSMSQTITDSINGEVTPTSMILTVPLTIHSGTDYTITYDLNPVEFTDATCAPTVCMDCMYDLSIVVKEEDCGTVLFTSTQTINGGEYDALCNEDDPYGWDTTLFIPQDNYVLIKTLTINQDAINGYWCTYLEGNTCVPTFTELFNAAYANADFDSCDDDILFEEDGYSCAAMKVVMLNDMSPGGQYAEYTVSGSTYTAANTISVLYTGGTPALSGDWRNPSGGYKDEDGNQAYVEVTEVAPGVYNPAVVGSPSPAPILLPNGNYHVQPELLANLADFVLAFQDSWAEALLPYHPEYCYLEFCEDHEDSHVFDATMNNITTFDEACATGYFAPLGFIRTRIGQVLTNVYAGCDTTAVSDPFFMPESNPHFNSMYDKMFEYATINGVYYSMWEWAIIQVYCTDTMSVGTCLRDYEPGCEIDLVWLAFRDMYLDAKAALYAQAEMDSINANGCNATTELIGVSSPFADAVPRWGFYENMLGTYTTTTSIQDELDNMEAQVCESVCAAYADEWLAQLANCQDLPTDPGDLAALRDDLIALCAAGCSQYHPYGATTLPPSVSIVLSTSTVLPGGSTINDVLEEHISGFTESDLCSELLISDPGPYQTDLLAEHYMDTCGCELLLQTREQFEFLESTSQLPAGITTIEAYLAHTTGIAMEDADALICQCDATAGDWTPEGYVWSSGEQDVILGWKETVDPALTCDACVTCDDVEDGIADLIIRFGSGVAESPNYELLLTNFLNQRFDFDLTFGHYQEFLLQCSGDTENPYCKPTEELLNWRDVMNLLAHRGQLVGGSSESPLDLLSENIVYKTGALFPFVKGDGYYAAISENVLLQLFVKGEEVVDCPNLLTLPEGATYQFQDIVSFGQIMPVNAGCDPVSDGFTVEIYYIDCGELVLDTISGVAKCFPVQICSCEPPILCNESVQEQFADNTPCYEPTLSQLYQQVEEQYAAVVAAAKTAFATTYTTACANAFATENMQYTGPFNQYQYTLFYYDQAGNLVKTVAPKGVDPLTTTATVVASRDNTTGIDDQDLPVVPTHTFETRYTYNSYNQLVATENPDQDGETQYWYDRYGRIVASQNPEQAAANRYSYIFYDPQGRPVETGQVVQSTGFSESLIKADDLGYGFAVWVTSVTRTEVTYTYYDESMSGAVAAKFATGTQQNLRLRVASVLYFDQVNDGTVYPEDYTTAIHYSYDLHGNVIEVLQDVPQLAPVEQDIKSTRYEFELLSGNVKKVHYQKGRRSGGSYVEDQRDRITHEYVYDQLNRLTDAYTSTDKGVHKSREAHYRYFDYGPLARVEIGQYQVQGNDYSYTIHGWLKSMNSSVLNSTRDAGLDGSVDHHPSYPSPNPEQHVLFARDVLGYALGYYDGDYTAIGTNNYVAGLSSGDLFNGVRSLYNGNIAYTSIAIEGFANQATAYNYDQLQRLTQAQVYTSAANLIGSNNWNDAVAIYDYYSVYTYDANGNLDELRRLGTGGTLNMDQFTYHYAEDANRLVYVDDAIGSGNYSEDIDDQSGVANQPITASQASNNYQYDKLGQLIKDVSEDNLVLEWRNGDKKLKLQRNSTMELEFVYNPLGQRLLKIQKPVSGGSVVAQSSTVSWLYTYYAYDAGGQVMATYDLEMNPVAEVNIATLDEQMLYGMSRIGVKKSGTILYTDQQSLAPEGATWDNYVGQKQYELTNHLGNVNAVITDRKTVNQNYVVNTFTSSTESWLACTNASVSQSGGNLQVTGSGGSNNCTYKLFTVTANVPYVLRIKSKPGTGVASLDVQVWDGATMLLQQALADDDFTTLAFTCTGTSATIIIEPSSSGSYTLDEVSLTPNSLYEAVVVMQADYYPFGMTMPGRVANPGTYRYAYNGMEVDPETKGNGNSYTTEFRQYDPRLARWLSLDPLMAKYPQMSPYCAFNNNPVFFVDPLGLEGVNATGDGGKKNKDKRVGGQSGSGMLAASVFNTKLGKITELEEVVVTADAPRDKNGKRIGIKPKSLEWGPMKIGKPISNPKNTNDGRCFPGAPTLGGTPSSYDDGYRVVPGTTYGVYKKDYSNTKKAAMVVAFQIGNDVTGIGVVDDVLLPFTGTMVVGSAIIETFVEKKVCEISTIEKVDTKTKTKEQPMTPIYRSISSEEMLSIVASGGNFSFVLGGMEAKQFWLSEEGLNKYNSTWAAGDYTITVLVPSNLIGPGNILNTTTQVDIMFGPSATVDNSINLQILNIQKQIISITPNK